MVFIPNPALPVLLKAELRPEALSIAEKIAEAARTIAAEGSPPPGVDSGSYIASIEAAENDDGAEVGASGDPPQLAVYLEFGTVNMPAFHVLTQAVERAGFRLGEAR